MAGSGERSLSCSLGLDNKDWFQKEKAKLNIEFTIACTNHDSGTPAGCDFSYVSKEAAVYSCGFAFFLTKCLCGGPLARPWRGCCLECGRTQSVQSYFNRPFDSVSKIV